MKATRLTVLLWCGLMSPSFAQESSFEQLPLEEPVVRVAEASTIRMTRPNRSSSTRRPQVVSDNQADQNLISEPTRTDNQRPNYQVNQTSFNATQVVSKLLFNPDQFWTRKSRPVIDQRGEYLFGDPDEACDEWRNYCGCCGLKANPGHLGIKSLRGTDPCECVDDCCPESSRARCKCKQCR